MVWLPRNKRVTHWLNSRPQIWPSRFTLAMILTLNFQGFSRSNVLNSCISWMAGPMWKEKEVNWLVAEPTMWPWLLTTCMAFSLDFQGQILKYSYLGNGRAMYQVERNILHIFITNFVFYSFIINCHIIVSFLNLSQKLPPAITRRTEISISAIVLKWIK